MDALQTSKLIINESSNGLKFWDRLDLDGSKKSHEADDILSTREIKTNQHNTGRGGTIEGKAAPSITPKSFRPSAGLGSEYKKICEVPNYKQGVTVCPSRCCLLKKAHRAMDQKIRWHELTGENALAIQTANGLAFYPT